MGVAQGSSAAAANKVHQARPCKPSCHGIQNCKSQPSWDETRIPGFQWRLRGSRSGREEAQTVEEQTLQMPRGRNAFMDSGFRQSSQIRSLGVAGLDRVGGEWTRLNEAVWVSDRISLQLIGLLAGLLRAISPRGL
jgi:hypothetical protein